MRCGVHMARITIAMRHSQGVTTQYNALSLTARATLITQLTVESCEKEAEDESEGNLPMSLIHTNIFHGTLTFGIA